MAESRRGPARNCLHCGTEFLAWKPTDPAGHCSRSCALRNRPQRGNGVSKDCIGCLRNLPLDSFSAITRKNRNPDRIYRSSRCMECRRSAHDFRATRDRRLRDFYKITADEFDEALARQGGCKVCGRTESNGKYWHVDHDHKCCPGRKSCGACVRGILCHGCNTALGNIDDDVHILRKMIACLEAS